MASSETPCFECDHANKHHDDTTEKGFCNRCRNLNPYHKFTEHPTRYRPTSNPNPYTFVPGPPRVTPGQLQALVDAVGKKGTNSGGTTV